MQKDYVIIKICFLFIWLMADYSKYSYTMIRFSWIKTIHRFIVKTIHTHTHIHTNKNIYTHINIHIHPYKQSHIHIYTYTNIHILKNANTHRICNSDVKDERQCFFLWQTVKQVGYSHVDYNIFNWH